MTDREEREQVLETLTNMRDWMEAARQIRSTPARINALNYAISSIKTDLKYDLLYEGNQIADADKMIAETYEWIPVDKRLPKAFEFVNCTCHSLIDDREDWVIETVYIPQPPNSPYSDWGNIPMLNCGDCKVVAWVHRDIPEPYKPESEEEE